MEPDDGPDVTPAPERAMPPSAEVSEGPEPEPTPGTAQRRTSSLLPTPLRVASELAARFLLIVAALSVLGFLIVQLRVVVIPAAIALLLAALLAPAVATATERLMVPRGAAVGVVLVSAIAVFALVMSFVVNAFIAGLPELMAQLAQSYKITIRPLLAGPPLRIPMARLDDVSGEVQRSISTNIDVITSGALSTAATVGEIVSGTLLLLFVLLFFLLDGGTIWRFVLRGVPRTVRTRVDIAGKRAFASLVGYTRATVVVAVVDALGIGLGLWLIGVPLVVPLAALVFLGAFVPVVGAVLSGSVSVLVALVANGPIPAAIVLGVVIAVMQLESHVLQPILLGRAVQLHPLAVVLGVAAGVVVAGIAGALLIVPMIAVLSAGIRSLTSPEDPTAADIDALDPMDGEPDDRRVRRSRLLMRIATGVVRRQPGAAGRGASTVGTSPEDTREAADPGPTTADPADAHEPTDDHESTDEHEPTGAHAAGTHEPTGTPGPAVVPAEPVRPRRPGS